MARFIFSENHFFSDIAVHMPSTAVRASHVHVVSAAVTSVYILHSTQWHRAVSRIGPFKAIHSVLYYCYYLFILCACNVEQKENRTPTPRQLDAMRRWWWRLVRWFYYLFIIWRCQDVKPISRNVFYTVLLAHKYICALVQRKNFDFGIVNQI